MQRAEAAAAALPPKKRKLLQCASTEAADEAARSRREQRLEMNRRTARIRRRRKLELIEELQNAMSELTRKNAALRERNEVLRAELGRLVPEEPESAAKAADGNAASTDPLAPTLPEAESQRREGGDAKDHPLARAAALELPRAAPQREQSQRHAMPLVAALRIGGRAASAGHGAVVATGIDSSCHMAQRSMAGGSLHRHSVAGAAAAAVAAPSPPQGGGDAALHAQLLLTRMLSMGAPVAMAAPTTPAFALNPEQMILATRLLATGRRPQQQQQHLQDPQRAYAATAATAKLSCAGAQQQPKVAAAAATISAQIQSAASAAANDLLRRRIGSPSRGGAFGSAVLR